MDVTTSSAVRLFTVAIVCITGDVLAEPVFQGLGDLPGGYFESQAFGVSEDGSFVVGIGSSEAAFDGFQPVRWTVGGDLRPVGTAGDFGVVRAEGVSADGSVVVGTDAEHRAVRWSESGNDVPLAGPRSTARDVSPDGSIVVGGFEHGSVNEAFRWSEQDGLIGLGFLPNSDWSEAWAVSDDGETIVGASGSRAFKWTESTGPVALGSLTGNSGSYSWATDVSNDGTVIVGNAATASGRRPFRWTEETGMIALGDLPGETLHGIAYAVSGDGSIVVGTNTSSAGPYATIWDEQNGMRSITDVLVHDFNVDVDDWRLLWAWGVSDDGTVIVGIGSNSHAVYEAWIARIPEPGSGVFICCGWVLLARRRIRP